MSNSEPPPRPVAIENRSGAGEARQFSPSAARNRGPILKVLTRVLPNKGIVLEIGSGTGEHVACFAKALPGLVWMPSDPDEPSRISIEAWIAAEGLANVRAPIVIDVREEVWGVEDDAPFDAIVSLNMVHIAPWEAALGLLAGAGRLLRPKGILFFYGPFMRGGTHTAESNAAFDIDLRKRDPRWGVRDVDDLVSEGAAHGLALREVVDMPANNLSLIFVKADSDPSKTLQLLNILEDPKGASARKKYLKLLDLNEINDQSVYELIEDLVIEATLLKDPVIEIRTDLAQQILIMLKQGIKRFRGGQQNTRYEKLRKRALVDLGRRIKEQLITAGSSATEAHQQASEEAAAEGQRYGLNYKASYLAREMDKAKQ